MTTLIELTGAKALAKGRPVLTAMDADLLASWRPYETTNSLIDLTGNGHLLTAVGNPVFTDSSIQGGAENFYRTDIQETAQLTMMAVFRVLPYTAGGAGASAFVFGNYNYSSGVSLYIDTPSVGGGNVDLRLNYVCQATGVQGLVMLKEAVSLAAMTASPWIFAAVTVNGTSIAGHIPKTAGVNRITASVSGRTISPTNLLNFLGSDAAGDQTLGIDLAYMGFADTALADADVIAEYARVKASFLRSRPDITGL